MDGALGWVPSLAALLGGEARTEDVLARLGGTASEDDGLVRVEGPSAIAAASVLVALEDGAPSWLRVRFAAGAGPLLADAEEALGAWAEYPRPGPLFQGRFAREAGCDVTGSTYDAPGTTARRLVEVAIVRGG